MTVGRQHRRLGLPLLALVLTIPFAAPFVYLLQRNLADPGRQLDIVADARLVGPLLRSLALGAAVVIATAIAGTLAAWLVTRTDLPARRLTAALLTLPLVIPSFIGAFAIVAAVAPGGLLDQAIGVGGVEMSGFWPATVVLALLTFPFVFLPVAARLAQLPRAAEESARMLGRGPLATFATVVLPQAGSAIAGGALLVFLYVISDFGAVQILRYDTLTRAIYANRLLDPAVAMALSLALAAIALVAVAGQRLLTGATPRDQRRGGPTLRTPLGRWRWPAAGFLIALVGASLLLPIAVLGYWATRGLLADSDRASALAADPAALVGPTINTAYVGILAALVTMLVVLPIAYALQRRRTRTGEACGALVTVGFALPGLVTALAIVFATLQAPGPVVAAIYQTLPLLIVGYVVHFGALGLQAAGTAVASVPRQLDDAARILGKGRIRRFRDVELPLMLPSLAAGAGLVLLSVMKELPATLLLSPTGFSTLATRIWGLARESFLADASIASLVLLLLSGALTWLLVIRGGRSIGEGR